MRKLIIFAITISFVQYCYAGENQWTTFILENHTPRVLYLTDVAINYGKWYRTGCKLCELKTVEQTIGPGSHALVNAAGRLLSPTGTDGEFAIYDGPKSDKTTKQIVHVYFSVPYLLGAENIINIKPFNQEEYPTEAYGGKPKGTALGIVTIKIYDKESIVSNN